MSAVELKVPSVGESITEVQIGDWLKSEGEGVEVDEPIVVIETDKVTVELPAPAAGVLTEIRLASGATAEVGDVIGLMEAGAAPKAAAPAPAKKPDEEPDGEPEKHVMPAARRALAEREIDPRDVKPSGPGGRLLKEDVLAHEPEALPAAVPDTPRDARHEEVVPMTPMRRRIADRLVQAQNDAAILTTFNEIDMSAVMALRKQHKERFLERHGVKLGFMSFFVKAAVEALKVVPGVNAEVRGDAIAYRNYYDIGVAVGGGKGLVVPVLRNAERMSFAGVEKGIADYATRAKANKLALEELQGGTFTISNGGIYGSLLSTPILNPPQSGILGLHAIKERAMVVDGELAVRPMMYVALSYDHRVVDGREAVTFLKTIVEAVESPARILLEI
jgi:2-oxoglutarate dehydrogenase E2 component (dihydrolipoamide succinyltransferase)